MLTTTQRLSMLEIPAGVIDVVIDSDTYNEIDDQFAISYALLSPERCRVFFHNFTDFAHKFSSAC